jgi:hypothetical protein
MVIHVSDGSLRGLTTSLRVAGAPDVPLVTEALAAVPRLYRVTEHGDERAADDPCDDTVYTANWVHMKAAKTGPVLHVAAKGDLTEAMRTRMLDIVVDELVAHGVTTATVDSGEDHLGRAADRPPATTAISCGYPRCEGR